MSASKKVQRKKTPNQIDIDSEPIINRRREWRFDIPLTATVEGKLPKGKKFKESIILENISSGGAYFCLDSGVIVGSKINLVIELPEKIAKGKKLQLYLGGITIRLEEPNKEGKKQGVAIRFSKRFKIIPGEKKEKK